MTLSRSSFFLVVGVLLVLSGSAVCGADGPRVGPFHKSCLNGRYTMATTAWDVSEPPPGVPLALTGYITARCTTDGYGTYTGQLLGTYPNEPNPPITCLITLGTYTIDPGTGAITMAATLADPPSSTSCSDGFPSMTVSESGFISDPSAKQIDEVETSQQAGSPNTTGVIIHYIWTRQP